jgi:hypothetical protein
VETLLDRGTESDLAEAEAAVERLATAPAEEGLVMREIWLLRLRALLARAHGEAAAYAHLRDRYRDMAKTLGFDGHIAWAEAMPRRRSAGRHVHLGLKQTTYERIKSSYWTFRGHDGPSHVRGHEILPIGGHLVPRWWPSISP